MQELRGSPQLPEKRRRDREIALQTYVHNAIMKKNDFILMGCILIAALGCGVFLFLFSAGEGGFVTVTQDGQVTGTYSLEEDVSLSFTDAAGGRNILRIQDGTAYMSEADCPDGLCMHQKAVSRKGESIICLPHRLVIEVTDGEDAEVDAVVQ